MQQPDSTRDGIDEIDRSAVGDVNSEQLTRQIRDQSIDSGVLEERLIGGFCDGCDLIAMDLLGVVAGGNFRKLLCDQTIVVRCEIAQCELAIAQNIDPSQPWNPSGLESRQFIHWF